MGEDGSTVEVLALLVSVLFGGAAAWYGRKSYKASKEELVLSREQASRVPALALTSAELLPLHADTDLAKEVNETREIFEEIENERERKRQEEEEQRERERREREQREREEREERRRRGEIIRSPVDISKLNNPAVRNLVQRDWIRNITPMTMQYPMPWLRTEGEPYKGPLPDAFIEIEIKNKGRAAAYEVTIWLTLDESALQPVDYFAEKGVDVISEGGGESIVEVRAQRDSGRLLPSENDWHLFLIPVLRHRTEGSATARYEITSPQGGGEAKGEVELPLDFSKTPTGEQHE